MNVITRHLSRCLIAGVVALLPVGGTIVLIAYLESTIADWWLSRQSFYFPGLGLLAAAAIIYAIGLLITTVVGRWLWRLVNAALEQIPALGSLYQTLKQIAGYGGGKDAIFRQVVLVPSRELPGDQLGLVTNEVEGAGGARRAVVFVPGAPNPTTGQLLLLDPALLRPVDMPVNDAMKALVSVGKTELSVGG